LSQKKLALKIGISPPNLSQWESMATPPLDGIMRVCNELDYPLWQFFRDDKSHSGEPLPPWIKPEHIDFIRELNKLPDDMQHQLLKNFTEIISLRKFI